jgi:hypothetical protein
MPEMIGYADHLLVVVFPFVHVELARKEISFAMQSPGVVNEHKVVFLQLRYPIHLSTSEVLWFMVVFEVLMIGDNFNSLSSSKEIFPPFHKTVQVHHR